MRRFVPTLLMTLALAVPAAAQQSHPDFSGDWTLDAAHSQLPGMGGAPPSITMHVEQSPKAITMQRSMQSEMGGQDNKMTFALDSTTSKNTVNAQGMSLDMNSKTAWAGDTLIVTTTADVQGQTISQTDRWSLSADKKTLSISTNANIGGQSMGYTMAFAKK